MQAAQGIDWAQAAARRAAQVHPGPAAQAARDAGAGAAICRRLVTCARGGADAAPAASLAERLRSGGRSAAAMLAPAHLLALLLHDVAGRGGGAVLGDPALRDCAPRPEEAARAALAAGLGSNTRPAPDGGWPAVGALPRAGYASLSMLCPRHTCGFRSVVARPSR